MFGFSSQHYEVTKKEVMLKSLLRKLSFEGSIIRTG